MGNSKRAIVMGITVAVLCLAVIAGTVTALFSDSAEVNNHLSAGSLKVGLYRTEYETRTLNSEGLIETVTDSTRVDLRSDGNAVFDVDNAAPTGTYKATIEVSNLGSVAFDYGVKILWTDDETDGTDQIFASQILVTISVGGTQKASFLLADCAKEENSVTLGSILANSDAQTFTVEAEFCDQTENNSAQLATIEFDLQVFATQKTD